MTIPATSPKDKTATESHDRCCREAASETEKFPYFILNLKNFFSPTKVDPDGEVGVSLLIFL